MVNKKRKNSGNLERLLKKKERLDKKSWKKYKKKLEKIKRKRERQINLNKQPIFQKFKGFFVNEKDEDYSIRLTDKMVQVEMQIAESFGKPISFKETQHYKSLNEEEKNKLEDFMRKRYFKRNLATGVLILFGGGCLLASGGLIFTGEVIKDITVSSKDFLVNNVVFSFFSMLVLLGVILTLIIFTLKRKFNYK